MHSLSPNRRLHRHRSWRRKDPPLVRPEFTIQFLKFICRSRDQNWRFKLTLFLLQEKLHSQKRVHIFHPALASQCCEHFVFYSRRWAVLWLGCFSHFLTSSSVLNVCYSPHLRKHDCYCLYRHSSAEWRHWVSACPVAVWGGQQKRVPAPSRRIHITYISIIWWAVVLHISFRQQ